MKSVSVRERKAPIVSRREWLFVGSVGSVALVFTSIPYVLGALNASEARVFAGFVLAVEDCFSYMAKMRQGAEGAWLFHLVYTPEPHPGTLLFMFHLMLGKIAAVIPGGTLAARCVWVYHAARIVFGLGLLATVYRFLSAFTTHLAVRQLAWLMVTFGGGLGWLLALAGQTNWLGSLPLDLILPEGFTFLVLYAFPHIALARALLLGGVLFLLRAEDISERAAGIHSPPDSTVRLDGFPTRSWTRGLRWAAGAGGMWLLMGLIVPFYVMVAWAVLGATWIMRSLWKRQILWRQALQLAVAALISLPIVGYNAWLFTSEPVYATWAAQNLIMSPHPLHYVAAYGLLLVLAGVAVVRAWRMRRGAEGVRYHLPALALVWVGLVPLLVYLPFNLQRRLVEGVQIPLSLLAAVGVVGSAWRGLKFRAVIVLVMVALSLTNALLVVGNSLALQSQPSPVFRDMGEVVALDWLAEQVGVDDVVLGAYETGNYLPARVSARVFVGHGPESIRAKEKRELVARFFDASTSTEWRRQLLDDYGVNYVFWGLAERKLGSADLETLPYLRPLYDVDGYVIFAVEQ